MTWSRVWPLNGGGTWRYRYVKNPTAFRPWGEINSSGLSCLIGVDSSRYRLRPCQVELLEQLALPDQQIGQPTFMLE